MNRRVFAGVSASGGVALGVAYRTDRVQEHLRMLRGTGDPVRDIAEAFDAVAERLRGLAGSLRDGDHGEQADIVDAAGLIAADPDLRAAAAGLSVAPSTLDDVRSRIRRLKHSACHVTAQRALNASTAEQVWKLVELGCFAD